LKAEDRLVVALDGPLADIRTLVAALPFIRTFKIGMEAFYRDGPEIVREIRGAGHDVFLDLKLHDIPNTVRRATAAVGPLGVRFLTVHASGGGEMVGAAVAAARESAPELTVLGVTLLTSLSGEELSGVWDEATTAEDKVTALARLAIEAGAGGVVAAAREAARLRALLGPSCAIVCPGIRPEGGDSGDQRRVATPGEAIEGGASHLVVGRPIIAAPDPAEAARRILEEMRQVSVEP
jgi:orotidine-5'-phosphate decarboxylase